MTIPKDKERRLLFILHRALVEARLLAHARKHQQVLDLTDAIEPLPGWIASWREDNLSALRENLEQYAAKYPDSFRYLDFIDKYEPPPF